MSRHPCPFGGRDDRQRRSARIATAFRQDHDSTVGGRGYTEVAYTYAKATSGRNTIRRATETLPDGSAYTLNYRAGNFDDYASRVSSTQDAYETDCRVSRNSVRDDVVQREDGWPSPSSPRGARRWRWKAQGGERRTASRDDRSTPLAAPRAPG